MGDAAWHHDSSVWISIDGNDLVKESSSLVILATHQVSLLLKSGKLCNDLMVPSSGRSDGAFLYSNHLVQSPCKAFAKEYGSIQASLSKSLPVFLLHLLLRAACSSCFLALGQLNSS